MNDDETVTGPVLGWERGDVVAVTDGAHPHAICVFLDDDVSDWMFFDDLGWAGRVSYRWVEARSPRLLVRKAERTLQPEISKQ